MISGTYSLLGIDLIQDGQCVRLSSQAIKENGCYRPRRYPILRIGDREFGLSRYPQSGDTTTVIFTLTAQEFAQLQDSASLTVQYGSGPNRPGWNFGKLNKGQLK